MNIKKLILISAFVLSLLFSSVFVVSADGYTISNATDIQKHIVGISALSQAKQNEYDFDNDGELTINDATYLQKLLVESNEIKYPTRLALNTESINLGESEVYNLTVDSDSPDFPFIFASDNPKIAVVDNSGTVLAISSGTATITCSSSNGLTASCEVTVGKMAQSVTLNKTSLNLGIGETYDLNSTVPSGTVAYYRAYSSNNAEVASVTESGGIITAKGIGTATVTCTLANGVTARCEVTVGAMAQSVTLNKTSLTLGISETFDLTSTVPSGTVAYYRAYSTNDSSVASVTESGGLITAKTAGTATITCTLANGVKTTCTVTVKKLATSLALNKSSLTIKVGQTFDFNSSVPSGTAAYYRSYSTSNSAIVSVTESGGLVTARKQGTATITCTLLNGVKATCKITVSGSVVKCLDVSEWQSSINFEKVKADGYDYVIIRAGYGKETYQKDARFEENYKKAKAAGLKVGAYWYAYATSKAEALEEAEACLYCIKGKEFDMPVYYDVEEWSQAELSKTALTSLIDAFCSTLESNRYQAGIYATNGMYWNIDKDKLKKNYSTWLAQIDGDFSDITDDLHQYTWTQKVDGISTDVDCNYIYNLNIIK